MSRGSISERATLLWFLARGVAQRLAGRAHRVVITYWPQMPGKTDRLVIAPHDLRTADATRASEIYAGRFVFAGKVVLCDARSPFEMVGPSEEWAESLFGFGWLRHLRAADSGITRANARALVDEWMNVQGALDPIAWRPEVVARRVMSWLSQATLVLDDADARFYRRFLRSLTRQVAYLRASAAEARDGVPRCQVAIALAYAALCMSGQLRQQKRATKRLSEELDRQILADGGHISRNPRALIELLLDLLPLRQVYTARNVAPPQALLNAIDRMMPMLRFFRHGDGNFALFNGMGPTPHDTLSTVLAYDDARGAPVASAAHSGYQRIESGDVLVIMDTGRVPPLAISQDANAGCLSFELSSRQNRIVVNCGLPSTGRETWRLVARATAAHSTVTFNDTSSARFVEAAPIKRAFQGVPLIGGPSRVQVSRDVPDHSGAVVVQASHDGYADRFGIVHRRTLTLSGDGTHIDGEDVFLPASGEQFPRGAPDAFTVRFHLHPAIKASRLSDGHGVMLMTAGRDVWTFDAGEDTVELEESVYLAGAEGPRRTTQITITGHARQAGRVQWSFAHVPPSATGARREQRQEPELPL